MFLLIAAAACSGRTAGPRAPDPWQRVEPAGAAVALYAYPETIERYAPEDRGAYVVRVPDGPERRAVLEGLGATDDITGEDGYVVRLAAAERDAVAARAGVSGVEILQPAARRSPLVDRTAARPEARIDLFRDATPDEVAAVAAWIVERGGTVSWKGRIAVRAEAPREVLSEAARLSPVRWVE